jgi:uncharacterized protein (DUF488 family)
MPKKVKNKEKIYTIGHSTRTIPEFVGLLKAHGVEEVVDVRTIPKSHHNPQFNENTLKRSLKKKDIEYFHMVELGGLRHTNIKSKNLGWNNKSFRGFADYMGTPEFEHGLKNLEKIAKKKVTTIMCAEAVPWRCHRSLIADALTKRHWTAFDIMSLKTASKHRLTPFLKVRQGKMTYPKPKDDSLST